MAINKSSAPPWVKIVIVVVVIAFVASVVVGSGAGLFSGSGTNQQQTGKFEAAAQKFAPSTAALDQQLASDPTSSSLLVTQANTYFDWAIEAQQATTVQGADKPIWLAAVQYYEMALKDKAVAGDPAVRTDLAIAQFNAGLVTPAIDNVEVVMSKDTTFPQAFFNAGIFYRAAGRNSDAVKALSRYLQLDPKGLGGQPDIARKYLSELGSTPASATP